MTQQQAGGFDVLLEDAADVPANLITESIAAFKKIPILDAAREMRFAWGFLGSNLSESDAKNFAAVLESKQVHARIIVTASIAPLPEVRRVKKIDADPAGLRFTLESDGTELVTPTDLKVIAVAGVNERSTRTEKVVHDRSNAQKLLSAGLWMSGIPVTLGKKKIVEKKVLDEHQIFYLDLLTNVPARRFRIDAQNISYAFLGDRKGFNMQLNFKIFLKELTAAAPQARLNKGVRMMMGNAILSQMGYESLADLEKETLWLSAL